MSMAMEKIQLAHGSGGKMSHDLVNQVIEPAFANAILAEKHDGARFCINGTHLAFTTDSYVVKPIFFPGGNIGKLAVCGTVNDLAMTGAVPLYLSAAFVIEEGFLLADLKQIVHSMAETAMQAGVKIVTGDTKVVEKGSVDGIYINTAGVGRVMDHVNVSGCQAAPGQDIILSGTLGEHSIAVMSERHGLVLPETVVSDCAPLNELVGQILSQVPQVAVLRDPTRGGLATTLNEIAQQSNVGIMLEETSIPVQPAVRATCDILGFDPLYLANEGKMLLFVKPEHSEKVLKIMHSHPYGSKACIIGSVIGERPGQVGLHTTVGGVRLLDMLTGAQLPRIC